MNKPLEEHGKKAQDMLLKYDYVETLDEFADGFEPTTIWILVRRSYEEAT